MSFLQRFLERVLRNNPGRMARTSFDDLTQDQLGCPPTRRTLWELLS